MLSIRILILRSLLHFGFFISRGVGKRHLLDVVKLFQPQPISLPFVRVGNTTGDGGYVIPDDFSDDELRFVFSPGVGYETSFDMHMAMVGKKVFMIDGSITSPANLLDECMIFEPLFCGSTSSGNTISINDWINKYSDGTGDMLLQMDIEGSEYECIISLLPTLLNKFRIIIIEFHNLENMATLSGKILIHEVMKKLTQNHYVVHIHPNNGGRLFSIEGILIPSTIEVTFLRKNRVKELPFSNMSVPVSLNKPSNPNLKEIILPTYWYKNN